MGVGLEQPARRNCGGGISLTFGIPAALALDRPTFREKLSFAGSCFSTDSSRNHHGPFAVDVIPRQADIKLSLLDDHPRTRYSLSRSRQLRYLRLQKLDRAQEEASLDLGPTTGKPSGG